MLSRTTVCAVLLLGSFGCGGGSMASRREPSAPAPQEMPPSSGETSSSSGTADVEVVRSVQQISVTGSAPGAMQRRTMGALGMSTGSGGGRAPTAPTSGGGVKPNADMLKIEARTTIEVDRVSEALVAARKLVAERGGQVVSDVYSDGRQERGAAITIRVPAAETTALLDALAGLGKVRSQRVSAEDVSREFHDTTIVLRNLELTMARYEELLKKAGEVKEMLAIEAELGRLRTEIDRVKGSLTFLGDRVARSILYVTLQPKETSPESFSPDSDFFPGVRGAFHRDLTLRQSAVGGGISLHGREPVGFEALVFSPLTGPDRPLLIATLGGDVYSPKLGGGRRRWLNPYMGFRMGVAYTRGRTEAIVPIGLGLDWLKTDAVVISTDVRMSAMFASARGLAFGVTPTLGVNVAF